MLFLLLLWLTHIGNQEHLSVRLGGSNQTEHGISDLSRVATQVRAAANRSAEDAWVDVLMLLVLLVLLLLVLLLLLLALPDW